MKGIGVFTNIFLSARFFYLLGGISILFAVSFGIPVLFLPAQFFFLLFIGLILSDTLLLFTSEIILKAERKVPRLFNLGDYNPVNLIITNRSNQWLSLRVIDELPIRLQKRDFQVAIALAPEQKYKVTYDIRPTERGNYIFGKINIFASTRIHLIERRFQFEKTNMEVPVYPSILQMKQMSFRAVDRLSYQKGIKKLRRIGHSYEFEQIKNYVRGDDYRSINWKASGRKATLMVNQYEDERSQQVYCIIDKSRSMRLPFAGLSLMDYAINTTLVMSNIALRKHDKAGLITFSDILGTTLKASSTPTQLNKILTALYNEKERTLEANFELLYYACRKLITGRSLLLLYTNFESSFALDRVLPILRKINKLHLVVVVLFENTEIRAFSKKTADSLLGIYQQVNARQFLSEKQQMVDKMKQYGIQAILTAPADLSVNTINKYLELKSRGLI